MPCVKPREGALSQIRLAPQSQANLLAGPLPLEAQNGNAKSGNAQSSAAGLSKHG